LKITPAEDKVLTIETIIVGIDPGSHRLGVGCVRKKGNSVTFLHAEVIQAPAKEKLYERLAVIRKKLITLLDELKPHEVALENIFTAKNVQSAFTIGIVRGVIFSICLERNVKIYEYAPTHVKSVVTGSGRADKEQVKKMVNLVLGTKIEMGLDATDAVAIAICHATENRALSC
jgi:crossover junction endodeoxyribonuclease RuvC